MFEMLCAHQELGELVHEVASPSVGEFALRHALPALCARDGPEEHLRPHGCGQEEIARLAREAYKAAGLAKLLPVRPPVSTAITRAVTCRGEKRGAGSTMDLSPPMDPSPESVAAGGGAGGATRAAAGTRVA